MALLTLPRDSCIGQPPADGALIPEGQRNATLTSLAGTMRRRGMTAGEIDAALTVVNSNRSTPPLSREEVRRIARSIGRYDPALPEPGPTLEPITATQLLAMEFPEPRWAIPPELVIEGLTILAGRPKEGKSFMALGFCLAVAVGGRALGHIPVVRGKRSTSASRIAIGALKCAWKTGCGKPKNEIRPPRTGCTSCCSSRSSVPRAASRRWTPGLPHTRGAGWSSSTCWGAHRPPPVRPQQPPIRPRLRHGRGAATAGAAAARSHCACAPYDESSLRKRTR